MVSLHKLPTKPTKLNPVSDTTVADGPSGPKTKKYYQDNIEKTSWELANVRLVPCLKNTNRDDFTQQLYIFTKTIYKETKQNYITSNYNSKT